MTLGEKIVFVADGSTHYMEYMRDENGDVYGFIYDGNTYFLEKNALGDVKYLLDGSGNVLAKYTYDAYGKVISVTDANGNAITDWANVAYLNPFRYRSYYYDFESGLYYLNSRYYDPELCRFVNADGYVSTGTGINGYNMFAYCGNNPVNRFDPTGHFWAELWDNFTETLQQASSYLAVAGGISQVDTIAPGPADIVSGILVTGIVLVCAGMAIHSTITAPASSVSVPQMDIAEKDKGKDAAIPKPSESNSGTTYYHVTTPENAAKIITGRTMTGSKWESGHVYAWRTKPSKYAVENSGAHTGVIISFKTNASFTMDTGITDPKVQMYGPVVSTAPGPIIVWDVQIVG